MTRFLSHHELENLYYLLERHEEAYNQLLEHMDACPKQHDKLKVDVELAREVQRQLISKIT